jgi:hypothetical protein
VCIPTAASRAADGLVVVAARAVAGSGTRMAVADAVSAGVNRSSGGVRAGAVARASLGRELAAGNGAWTVATGLQQTASAWRRAEATAAEEACGVGQLAALTGQ